MSAEPLLDDAEEDEPALDWREHPAPEVLESFMRAQLSREENSAIVRHLLTNCPQCRYITGRLWRGLARKPDSPEGVLKLLKEKKKTFRRQIRQQMPANPKRGEAAMAALIQAAQELLLEISEDLKGISGRLEGMAKALPPARKCDPETADVVEELRSIARSVLEDCLHSAIDDLRLAAYYPKEPPAKDDSGDDG